MRKWEIRQNGAASAPIDESEVEAMLAAGTLEGTVHVRPLGKDAWKPAMRHAPFASAAQRAPRREGVAPPPLPTAPPKDPRRWDQETQLHMPIPALLASAAPAPLSEPAPSPVQTRAAHATLPPARPTTGFLGGLFDFSFRTLVGSRVVKVAYGIFVTVVAFGMLLSAMLGFMAMSRAEWNGADPVFRLGVVQVLGAPVAALVVLSLGRLACEGMIVFFRIADHLGEIDRNTRG